MYANLALLAAFVLVSGYPPCVHIHYTRGIQCDQRVGTLEMFFKCSDPLITVQADCSAVSNLSSLAKNVRWSM